MENKDLERIRILRCVYDQALQVTDPVTYALRQQELLHAIAEYLIQPLQEHELAERSKLYIVPEDPKDQDCADQYNKLYMHYQQKCAPLHDLNENESEAE